MISNLLHLIYTHLLAPLWEVPIADHSDGVTMPGLGHGPYLCVGVTSDVMLQDSVDDMTTGTTTSELIIKYQNFISAKDVNT